MPIHMKDTPEAEIRGLIEAKGSICFAEFMQVALYHSMGGYYTSARATGAAGDYFTSPAAHPVFGALIAVQLHRMWQVLDSPSTFDVIEMGAGDGLLAAEVAGHAPVLGQRFARALRYVPVDRRVAQETAARAEVRPHPVAAIGVPFRKAVGCFISNELLDAFPVHRFRVEGRAVKELFVTLDEHDELTEALGDPCTPMLERRIRQLGFELGDGFSGEVNLGIGPWMREVSDGLERGFVLTIDYGYPAEVLYGADRSAGTLKTYYHHSEGGSPYVRIGRQDMTAHVDFSSVISEGEALGLRLLTLMPQSSFLKALGFQVVLDRLKTVQLSRRDLSANTMAMRELVKPEGLGGFSVLIQERGSGVAGYSDLTPAPEAALNLPIPLLGPEHTPLMEGRYPHLAMDFDELWPSERSL